MENGRAPGSESAKASEGPPKQAPQNAASGANKPLGLQQKGEDDEDEDDKEVPGTYNPSDYANL